MGDQGMSGRGPPPPGHGSGHLGHHPLGEASFGGMGQGMPGWRPPPPPMHGMPVPPLPRPGGPWGGTVSFGAQTHVPMQRQAPSQQAQQPAWWYVGAPGAAAAASTAPYPGGAAQLPAQWPHPGALPLPAHPGAPHHPGSLPAAAYTFPPGQQQPHSQEEP
eukprot:CAMPEP_0206135804 /NCGR_PEP_ID=MMETSP1473-20131121/1070_1 /ASSEMBLY_ACC=CAM_ASM_001109 /TAXON_ID=1461547 /ORGANISM="Stichococcus sp, Strain RCC1054" /LENGTH=160 /DNA_ID=CAMNT_0053527903 /DNA_START=257 /DNA_END=735 /DNA_ORIENTATION=-